MCEASKSMKNLVFAKEGETVVVGSSSGIHGSGGRLFTLADTRVSCCLPFGATVFFTHLPAPIQHRLGIGHEVEAVMMSPDPTRELSHTHRIDEFMIRGDETKRFSLNDLPFGTRCRVIAVPIDEHDEPPAVAIDPVIHRVQERDHVTA